MSEDSKALVLAEPNEELSLDRKLGRIEGRINSLEKSIEVLKTTVDSLVSIIDFAKKGLKVIYWAIGVIGLDGVIHLVKSFLSIIN